MKPLISVIIPAHNSAKTIGTAIQSMIDQTWKELEIIVIDDNSNDDTKIIVETFTKKDNRVSYYALPVDDPFRVNKRGRNVNAGWMARNYGLDRANGELITFQDADDVSLLNRIELEYELLKSHNATHVTIDWMMLLDNRSAKKFDVVDFSKKHLEYMGPDEIIRLARKTKGVAYSLLGHLASHIDFEIKRSRFINKLFFGTLDGYPGSGNCPLFKKEVAEIVRFRDINHRVWPSFVGRGADRDWNFQVAERFKNSYVFFVPLYLWRQKTENPRYMNKDIEHFLG